MNTVQLINVVVNFFPWGFVKLVILILLAFYVVFSAVIVRQEQLMARVIEIPHSPLLRVIAKGHLVASIIVFILALILI